VLGGPAAQRRPPGRAVDVQHVGQLAGDQADVGLGPALPPPDELVGVGGGVVEAVAGAGMLADRTAAGVAARAAGTVWPPPAPGLDGVVQRQDPEAPLGVGNSGIPEVVGGHWGCPPLLPWLLVARNSRSSSRP
jgi:hypothetical protein